MKFWWLRLTRYARPHWLKLSVVVLLMVAGVGLDVLKPLPMKLIIDSVLENKPLPSAAAWVAGLPGGDSRPGLLALLTGATLLLFLIGWASRAAQRYVEVGAGSRMTYDLGLDLFDHLQRLSLRFHGKQPAGDLVHRVLQNTGCVRDLILTVYLPLLTSLVSLAAMLTVMWQMDRGLSLLALLAAPLLGLTIRVFAQPMAKRSYEEMRIQGETLALAEQTLTALPAVQAYGREDFEDQRFSNLSRRAGKAYLRTVASQLGFQVGTGVVTAVGTAAIICVGGLHVLEGKLSMGSLLVFLSYLASLYAPLESLAYLSMGIASAAAGAKRVFEILESDDTVRNTPGAKPLPTRATGHLRLEKVVVGYEHGRPVLHGIDLEACPGETIALVGPTGAGKSTLVSLIPRFFDPWEGRITLDGKDLRDIQLPSLRSQIAIVQQDPFLLPMTVAENIAYGRPGASRDDIVKAAVAANAEEFIQRLPQGYDTVIGERGATLSGGERQRLAIARALLKDAPILVLDEPTSALDAKTEAVIADALDRLLLGRTTFVIAHRLSMARKAQRIVFIDRGCVVEEGSHQELLRRGTHYARFHELQGGASLKAKEAFAQ